MRRMMFSSRLFTVLVLLATRTLFVSAQSVEITAIEAEEGAVIPNAYVIRLDNTIPSPLTGRSDQNQNQNQNPHSQFHKRATEEDINYSVRHEFTNANVFFGLSITLPDTASGEDVKALERLPGVLSVEPVRFIPRPEDPLSPSNSSIIHNNASSSRSQAQRQSSMPKMISGSENGLLSALEMTGVDQLHRLGIKGKGIKIGIIDTGIDHRHPALGAGFGPGFKVEGGYSFVDDMGASVESPDPLTTCLLGGHGTHVAGIVGMTALDNTGFDIVGVAPEASIYAYRAFGCTGGTGLDVIIAAMSKALEDGVDILSMSVGSGPNSWLSVNPFESIVTVLKEAGVAVIAASGNFGVSGMYSQGDPGGSANAISVGSVSNTRFPLVYEALDSSDQTIKYASVWPVNSEEKAIYIVSPACDAAAWAQAFETVDLNTTIMAFELETFCTISVAERFWSTHPQYVITFNAPSTNAASTGYNIPVPGVHGETSILNINATHYLDMNESYASSGGYPNYRLNFFSDKFESVPQPIAGFMSPFSSWGPKWLSYDLKPQLSAPGGQILSTWPLGADAGYAIMSGTSMATPFAAGAFALVKSQFPDYSIDKIRELLQTTSSPRQWMTDPAILSSTAQQGAGLINPFKAIFSHTEVSPGEIRVGDDDERTHTGWGRTNITIRNRSAQTKIYTLEHVGAGFANYIRLSGEAQQLANYGSADFEDTKVTLAPGESTTVAFSIKPPLAVSPRQLPVFGGFIKAISSPDGETLTVPYVGAPYSVYNGDYIDVQTVSGLPLPRVWTRDATNAVVVNTGTSNYSQSASLYPTISAATIQFSQAVRIDVLPANTNISALRYGFDQTASGGTSDQTYTYTPSLLSPNSSVFGYPSFGTVYSRTGVLYPFSIAQQWADTNVLSGNGAGFAVGKGDYRFFLSVQRLGDVGDVVDEGEQEGYDTWLGPVVRVVD